MPGYEPFLLCDFHVHTTWSDGRLTLREVVDLYGQTEKFDVLAITDHILARRTCSAGSGAWRRSASGSSRLRPRRSTTTWRISRRRARARNGSTACVVIPGAEVTQNHIRAKHNSHIVALGLKQFISADLKAKEILEEIRRQGALSIACHPHHRTTTRMEIATCYLWDHRKELAELVDVWEAANRDDLFSVTSLKHYPYVANSDFHKAKHLYSWKTLVRSAKTWPAVKAALKSNVDIAITLFRKDSC